MGKSIVTTHSVIHPELSKNPVIAAFERSPGRGEGEARDMRVRLAMFESCDRAPGNLGPRRGRE